MKNAFKQEVKIPVDGITVEGELIIPRNANGIILFSHGSGSSRLSTRNRMVAGQLQDKNFGTLLFDLLTPEEDQNFYKRFDIDLLTRRLIEATKWLEKFPAAKDYPLGYFGASTGAASALKAASRLPHIHAVVSRGGRPDMAMEALHKIKAPTLFIVGGLDPEVLKLNKHAFNRLNCEKKLEVVEGASHLFDESGTMEKVCEYAVAWFEKYLQPVTSV